MRGNNIDYNTFFIHRNVVLTGLNGCPCGGGLPSSLSRMFDGTVSNRYELYESIL